MAFFQPSYAILFDCGSSWIASQNDTAPKQPLGAVRLRARLVEVEARVERLEDAVYGLEVIHG